MAAELVFVGGGVDSVVIVAGAVVEGNTAGNFDATYVDSALSIPSSGSADCFFLDANHARVSINDGETCFCHFEMRSNFDGAMATGFVTFYDSAGFPWVRLITGGSNQVKAQYNSNTGASPTWTDATGLASHQTSVKKTYDIRIKIASGGNHEVEIFHDNVSAASGTFSQPLFTGLNRARLMVGGTGPTHFSQVMIGRDLSTIGGKVFARRPTAIGNANAWTGAYTDIDEPVNSDTDNLSTNAAGNDFTFTYSDVALPANYTIRSVFSWMRAKNDGVSPSNVKVLCRNGGTTYATGANLAGVGLGYSGSGARFDNDPATAAAWSQAGFNSAEWGGRSAA